MENGNIPLNVYEFRVNDREELFFFFEGRGRGVGGHMKDRD